MADRPAPVATPETQPYWDGCRLGLLRIQRCERCAAHFFYPRLACPGCGLGDRVAWVTASGRGRLHSYVISHLPAPGYAPPFVIAVVELEEGPRMLTNVVGVEPSPDQLRIDMPVVVEFESRDGAAVPVFRPEVAAANSSAGSAS